MMLDLLAIKKWLFVIILVTLTHQDCDSKLPYIAKPIDIFIDETVGTQTIFHRDTIIKFGVNENSKNITFNSKDLEFVSITLSDIAKLDSAGIGVSIDDTNIDDYNCDIKLQQCTIHSEELLEPNKLYLLHIVTEMKNQSEGFLRVWDEQAQSWVYTTNFFPTNARSVFPCFDEPEYKVTSTVEFILHDNYTAITNSPLKELENRIDGLKAHHFEKSPRMSTHQMTAAILPKNHYSVIEKTTNTGVKISVHAPTNALKNTQLALDTAVQVMEFCEGFFGVPYNLSKYDIVAVPGTQYSQGWGLSIFDMKNIVYDAMETSSSNKQHMKMVIAHSIVSQWFGGLVTMKWWDDVWFYDGLSDAIAFNALNHIEPTWDMNTQFIPSLMTEALHLDSMYASHPISVPVNDPAQLPDLFDIMSFSKTSALFRMLGGVFTVEKRKTAIKTYLENYSFNNAASGDFWEGLNDEVKPIQGLDNAITVTMITDTWTKQMGYPVVTVTRNGSTVTVTQKHFLIPSDNQPPNSPYNYKWNIPLTYITSEDTNTKHTKWMTTSQSEVTFDLPTGTTWFKVNADMTGFFRVNYRNTEREALIQQLNTNHMVISVADRANLIEDIFPLANTGEVSFTQALEMTKYLMNETHYVPWSTSLGHLGWIGSLLNGEPGLQYYTKYMFQQMKPAITQLGFDDTGSHLDRFLRNILLQHFVTIAATEDIPNEPALLYMIQSFQNWMTAAVGIPPNLRSVVYQAGVKFGGESEWDHIYMTYKATSDHTEKLYMLNALASTRDKNLLAKFLSFSLNVNVISTEDAVEVLVRVANNPEGLDLTWEFIKTNWKEITERYGKKSTTDLSRIIKSTSHFKTNEKYTEVSEFFASHKLFNGVRAAKQSLEAIKNHINWLKSHESSVVDWFYRETE